MFYVMLVIFLTAVFLAADDRLASPGLQH